MVAIKRTDAYVEYGEEAFGIYYQQNQQLGSR